MTIRYIEPLRRSWDRMVEQLFRPFDLSKWIIVGFTCWLARLVDGGGGGNGGVSVPPPAGDGSWGGSGFDPTRFDPSTWSSSWESFFDGLGVGLLLAGIGCIFLVVIAVVLLVLWLSSRGHFLFLDNVVQDRALVGIPWREYRREGNSLFLWRLGFTVVCALGMLAVAAPGIWWLITAASQESGSGVVGALVVLLVPVLLVAIALAFVDLFLTDFVVPIMYRQRLKATEAWRLFLPRLKENLAELVLYGFFVLGLHILVFVAIFAVSIWTCCIPFLILILPVVGTVVLLPFHLTYRIFSLEFLSQLGGDLGPLPSPSRPQPTPESPAGSSEEPLESAAKPSPTAVPEIGGPEEDRD